MVDAPGSVLEKEALDLAAEWLKKADSLLSHDEKRFRKRMSAIIGNATDKIFLTEMIDQSFRSDNPARIGDQIAYLFKKYGTPRFFSFSDRILVKSFLSLGRHTPGLSVPLVMDQIRRETGGSIIQGDPGLLSAYLKEKQEAGFRVNLNHLGEAVLGETEALTRLHMYLADLKNPEIEQISVKISSIYSQVNPLAFGHTVDVLKQRLRQLYKTAAGLFFKDQNRDSRPKFVNLDMEDYRDLEITAAAFRAALEGPDFLSCSGGIALQAYLPDSFAMQQELTRWARKRVKQGSVPIKIRLVKGANMQMEMVEAAIRNWPLATYSGKTDTDANYKRMIDFGLRPENVEGVSLGIASHNLFDLAYAANLAKHRGTANGLIFEMLTGMADHMARALQLSGRNVLLYAPHTSRENFINAIAYLVRRLDENSGAENFLRHSFDLTPGSPEWEYLKQTFLASCRHMASVSSRPHRSQNRMKESFQIDSTGGGRRKFRNEPDTDWSLSANREWAEAIRKQWRKNPITPPVEIPLVLSGQEKFNSESTGQSGDPSRYAQKVVLARYAMATEADVEAAVAAAKADPDHWRTGTHEQRRAMLSGTAVEIRRMRGELIGAAAAETGKTFAEADAEVSEAIDFLEYYPYSIDALRLPENVRCTGRGAGIVVSPWNFPISIPCGGMAAALAAGNTVIFKPSSDAVLVGWTLYKAFRKAGFSANTLQFLPCPGSGAGRLLVGHPEIDFVIFTGGTETGLEIWKQRPDLFLAAETGGKNATIVTAMADRDQAVKNVIESAFSNAGQKCSATSLLILEKEVYEDPKFRKQLVDAAQSLNTGPIWAFTNRMGPLIRPPRDALKQALTRLEPGESWALEPHEFPDNPHLWTPGIKWDVSPGSSTHMTELFGPLLAVMRADDLDHAIALTHQTGYGLTSGLESLDEREHEKWKAGIKAGNLYINRSTTGAVVFRQPFGGMRKSALGPAIKAGGPNTVTQFMTFTETGYPQVPDESIHHPLLDRITKWRENLEPETRSRFAADLDKTIRAIRSYLFHAREEFRKEKDYFQLRGQDNIHRYLTIGKLVVRLHPQDTSFEILARVSAALIARCRLSVSVPPGFAHPVLDFLRSSDMADLLSRTGVREETDAALSQRLPEIDRIRYAAPDRVPPELYRAAAEAGFYIARSPVLMEGRLELLHYYQNQSICFNYHRYGNLGRRGEKG